MDGGGGVSGCERNGGGAGGALSAMGETRAQGPGEDEDRSKVTSGTAPVPLTPQRISPPAAYFPRFAQMRAAGVRYGQPNNVNPQPH
ncbi:hypothetical protein DXB04_24895 [Enterocloster bolteae]|nr:hypothetical protein DXB04_24895 [Enterocloster bolteae]